MSLIEKIILNLSSCKCMMLSLYYYNHELLNTTETKVLLYSGNVKMEFNGNLYIPYSRDNNLKFGIYFHDSDEEIIRHYNYISIEPEYCCEGRIISINVDVVDSYPVVHISSF